MGECEKLVATQGLDYEKVSQPTLRKLVGSWSCSLDEPEVR